MNCTVVANANPCFSRCFDASIIVECVEEGFVKHAAMDFVFCLSLEAVFRVEYVKNAARRNGSARESFGLKLRTKHLL